MALTPKQQRFVEEYLIDLNATQAAIRAGYSSRTAKQQGQRLLTNADVSAAVTHARAVRSERVKLTADDVLFGLHKEATLEGEGSSHSARVSAWGLIGKHLGMFKDKIEHSGSTVQTHIYLPRKDAPPDAAGDQPRA
jgi:phage terminase small subunit